MPRQPFKNRPSELRLVERDIAILRQKLTTGAEQIIGNDRPAPKIKRMVARALEDAFRKTAKRVDGQSPDDVFVDTLLEQLKYLNGFRSAIVKGELSDKQIIARTGSYARSLKLVFHAAEQAYWIDQGFTQGKRNLDRRPHEVCDDCDYYASLGWVDIKEVVLPGVDCRCRMGCRCDVVWRR